MSYHSAALAADLARAFEVAATPPLEWRGGSLEIQAATDTEIMLAGPAECLAPETLIYDPVSGLETPIRELAALGRPVRVMTADGPRWGDAPFRKGEAELFRVTTESGRSFVGTGGHRVLSVSGWTFVRELRAGASRLLVSELSLPGSSLDVSPSVSRLGDPRSTRIASGCLEHYSEGGHPYGGPLRSASGGGRAAAPSPSGALARIREQSPVGVLEPSRRHTRSYPSSAHPSIARSCVVCCPTGASESRVFSGNPTPCDGLCRFGDLSPTERFHRMPIGARRRCADSTRLHSPRSGGYRYAGGDSAQFGAIAGLDRRSRGQTGSPCILEGLQPAAPLLDACTLSSPLRKSQYTVQAERVVSVVRERHGEYYDMTVPDGAHFFAEGFWHHNTSKTYACCYKLHQLALSTPKAHGAIVRKVRVDMGPSVLRTWDRIVARDGGCTLMGGSHATSYVYDNGTVIDVIGIDKAGKVLSAEFDWVYVNQAEQLTHEDWATIASRCTGRGAVTKFPQIFGDCNPGPPTHWILHRKSLRKLYSFHTDNPSLYDKDGNITDQGRRTMESLENLPGVLRDRLLLGKWVQAEGVVYPEFDRGVNLVSLDDLAARGFIPMDSTALPRWWRRFASIDFGFTDPFVWHCWAVDGDGRMYLEHEVYRTGVLVEDHARAIKAFCEERKLDITATYADHARNERGTWERHFGAATILANKDIDIGLQKVRARLRKAGDGRPRLYVLADSIKEVDESLAKLHRPTRLVEEFEVYAYPKGADGLPLREKPIDKDNHACLSAETLVTTRRGDVSIVDVSTGDEVLTRRGYRPVRAAGMTLESADVLTLTLESGVTLTGTGSHPVWVRGGWGRMDSVRYGDMLTGWQKSEPVVTSFSARTPASPRGDGQAAPTTRIAGAPDAGPCSSPAGIRSSGSIPLRVVSVRAEPTKRAVFNLTVDGEPEFFANGVLVHNCDSARYAVMSQDFADEPANIEDYEPEIERPFAGERASFR